MAGSAAHPYTDRQIAFYASTAGFTGEDLVTAIAVTHPESGATMRRSIRANPDTTYDWGLWQINDSHKPSDAVKTDPQANANAAFKVFKERGGGENGWRAWSAYRAGLHKPFMDKARVAAKSPSLSGSLVDPVKDTVTSVPGAIATAMTAFNIQVTKLAGNAMMLTLALVLLVVGILIVARKQAVGAAGVIASKSALGKVGAVASTVADKALPMAQASDAVKASPGNYEGGHRA